MVPPSRLHARNGRVFFSKFLYVRIFPEYHRSIAHIQDYTSVYSEVVKPTVGSWKKLARPKIRQYFASPSIYKYTIYINLMHEPAVSRDAVGVQHLKKRNYASTGVCLPSGYGRWRAEHAMRGHWPEQVQFMSF